LDGDADRFEHGMFCAWKAAVTLADRSKDVGGGSLFSVACVFARQEYESWIIAGVESLAGRSLPDGRPGVKAGTVAPPSPEKAPRDAKGWLSKNINGGYKPTTHQLPLTDMVDVSMIRNRNLRSFRRVENALRQLVDAIRSGQHVVTPLAAIGNADSQDSPPTR
jgi:hypothetical protein